MIMIKENTVQDFVAVKRYDLNAQLVCRMSNILSDCYLQQPS
jgi:hypothetical protein